MPRPPRVAQTSMSKRSRSGPTRPTGRASARGRTSAGRPRAAGRSRSQVSRSPETALADPLHRAGLGARDAAVVACASAPSWRDDAAGPRREVVERAGRAGAERVGQHLPVAQVARDRVADRRVDVAQLGVAERARGLQIEHVDVVAVAGEPEVPHPVTRRAAAPRARLCHSTAGAPGATLRRVSATRGRIAGWGLALLVPANAVVVVALWWARAALQDVDDTASLLVGLGRISGLLGAYLVLVELLLLARLPLLERLAGFERLTRLAPRCNGFACVSLLLAPRGARHRRLRARRPLSLPVGARAADRPATRA